MTLRRSSSAFSDRFVIALLSVAGFLVAAPLAFAADDSAAEAPNVEEAEVTFARVYIPEGLALSTPGGAAESIPSGEYVVRDHGEGELVLTESEGVVEFVVPASAVETGEEDHSGSAFLDETNTPPRLRYTSLAGNTLEVTLVGGETRPRSTYVPPIDLSARLTMPSQIARYTSTAMPVRIVNQRAGTARDFTVRIASTLYPNNSRNGGGGHRYLTLKPTSATKVRRQCSAEQSSYSQNWGRFIYCRVSVLNGGRSTTIYLTATPTMTSSSDGALRGGQLHRIRVDADSRKTVREVNENNNAVVKELSTSYN